MKIPSRSVRSGFTLVELLVVIAIIAILASVITVSAGAAINAAKRAKAGNMASQIQTSIMNYYTEYGVYPLHSNETTDVLYSTAAAETDLMYALSGNFNAYSPTTPNNQPNNVSNARNIAFMTLKKSDVDTTGVPITPFSSGANFYYYSIAIDADYSGILGDSGSAGTIPDFTQWTTGKTSSAVVKLTQGAAVWACCDTNNLKTPASSTTPSQWVHTY